MSASNKQIAPGAYRFTVSSTEQAVTLIREKLGPSARVLSVRNVEAKGLKKFFTAPRLEVVAQVEPESISEPMAPSPNSVEATSANESSPPSRLAPMPPSIGLTGLLRRSGITESALNRLQSGANWPELSSLPLHRALAETSRLLRTQAEARAPRPPLSRAAFLGTPGVGRTTALCKWLAVEVFRRSRTGHVVSVEFDRPNPLGPLPVFSEALGVPLAHFPCETQPAVPGGFVYFDLPGISISRPADNAALAAWLDRELVHERVLVLNAAYDRASLREAYAAGRDLGATRLVFTHLDEVVVVPKVWPGNCDEALEQSGFLTNRFDSSDEFRGLLSNKKLS